MKPGVVFITAILIGLLALSAQASDSIELTGDGTIESESGIYVDEDQILTVDMYSDANVTTAYITGPSYNEEDIVKALTLALQYLVPPSSTDLLYRTPAMQLREQADRLDQRDKDIKYIESVLEELK